MKKILILMLGIFILSLTFVSASPTQQELSEAKTLIDSRLSCNNLNSSQLELIGEYIMEQQHPGEAHDQVDRMMGLVDGSVQDQQFHINLAERMYCNSGYNGGGMMGNYNGNSMMSGVYTNSGNNVNYYGHDMMGAYYGDYGYGYMIFSWIITILIIILLFAVIFFIIKNLNQNERRSKHGKKR